MAFYGHRCRRPECRHPDYWAAASRERGSVARGETVDGQPAVDWAIKQPGASLVRGSCGQCTACRKGCDYGPPEEMTQYTNEGFAVESTVLVPPGENTTGATMPGPIYACNGDACKEAHAAAS
jgi:hypothetical protein